jgi:periplasmic protein TonB
MKMSAANEGALQQRNLGFDPKPRPTLSTSPPSSRANPGVFATAIIEEDAQSRGKRAAQAGLALALQAAVVGALVIVPLFLTEAIDLHQFEKTMLVAPPPPAAPAPPVVRAQAVVPKQAFLHPVLTAPTVIPKKIVDTASDAGFAPPAISDAAGGVTGGTGDVLGASLGAPPPPPTAAKPKGPIRISSGMKQPRLLFEPPIHYSPIARQAHVEGAVIVEAIIDEQGNVTQARVISGPALLVASALQAVAGRKYEPTILDGEPVAIQLTVTVLFKLS